MGACQIKEEKPVFENGTVVTAAESFAMGVKDVKLPLFVKEETTESEKITCEKITHPWPAHKDKWCIMLRNVFSKSECEELIKLSEKTGYLPAMVNIGEGKMEVASDYRNNTRCMIDSVELGDFIFNRIKKWIPSVWDKRKLLSCNERLRFLRYHPGEFFALHQDGTYMRENGDRSYITVLFYLNEGFEGGHTTLMHLTDSSKNVPITPSQGGVLIFEHRIWHEGSLLKKGVKYLVRTDVMYSNETIE